MSSGLPRQVSDAEENTPMLVRVRGLTVYLGAQDSAPLVQDVSFDIAAGELVGLAGESGSGKSLTVLALARLLPTSMTTNADVLEFDGHDLLASSRPVLSGLLGSRLAMVFQNPLTSLNPTMRVGHQVGESLRAHRRASRHEAARAAVAALDDVHIADPQRRVLDYPHQFSGGMRQRAVIAMGVVKQPDLIIADEPTTALDVTVQARIVRLLQRMNQEHGSAVLLVSHNIPLLSQVCHRLLVMYAGRIVEDIPFADVNERARHPYTRALIAAVPSLTTPRGSALPTIPGNPPAPDERPSGCAFANRCALVDARCAEPPPMRAVANRHRVACWRVDGAPPSTSPAESPDAAGEADDA